MLSQNDKVEAAAVVVVPSSGGFKENYWRSKKVSAPKNGGGWVRLLMIGEKRALLLKSCKLMSKSIGFSWCPEFASTLDVLTVINLPSASRKIAAVAPKPVLQCAPSVLHFT
ncbi:hypothetical protein PIB30_031364 [Stylosanthes scabra]|uniref:Uncharacterized protein n=1 Tax=Stylosanthes scabra TaxID=79078 RepID=A0ABU6WDX5_9FABA|nr:hypothetical protein [Stylosanthes scabra]